MSVFPSYDVLSYLVYDVRGLALSLQPGVSVVVDTKAVSGREQCCDPSIGHLMWHSYED